MRGQETVPTGEGVGVQRGRGKGQEGEFCGDRAVLDSVARGKGGRG